MNERTPPGSRTRSHIYADTIDAAAPRARPALPRFLPLALGAVAGIVLVTIGVAIISRRTDVAQPPTVAPIAQQICGDLTTQRYGDLYSLLSSAQQALGTSAQFVATQRELDVQRGTANTCNYTISARSSSNATVTLSLARGTSAAASAQVLLTFERNAWRIADYDSSLVATPAHHSRRV